jgi:hypothetical protein
MSELTIAEKLVKLKETYFKLVKIENDKRIKDFDNKLSKQIDELEAKIKELKKQQEEESENS